MQRGILNSRVKPFTRQIGAGIISSLEKVSVLAAPSITKSSLLFHRHDYFKKKSNSSSSRRFLTTGEEKEFRGRGILDDEGMVTFETLHELQVRSSLVYSDNEIFGTFDPETGKYDWITYAEYSQRVNQCRTLLKDIGTNNDERKKEHYSCCGKLLLPLLTSLIYFFIFLFKSNPIHLPLLLL